MSGLMDSHVSPASRHIVTVFPRSARDDKAYKVTGDYFWSKKASKSITFDGSTAL